MQDNGLYKSRAWLSGVDHVNYDVQSHANGKLKCLVPVRPLKQQ